MAFGGALVGTGLTVAFGIRTLDAKNTFEANPTHDTLDTFKQDRLVTNAALGVAIVSAAIGLAIWRWAPRATVTSF